MIAEQYTAAVRRVLTHLETDARPAIEEAAGRVAGALRGGGCVFVAPIGHGLQHDFINRAGGLAAVQPFAYALSVTDPVAACRKDRPRPEPFDREAQAVRVALGASQVRAGDVMVTGSVSGRNVGPVELALACRERGVQTIGLTALAYTKRVTSLHPSGKRLFEAVDTAVDIGAPYGDAVVEAPGFDVPLLPVSGVATLVAGWMLWGRAAELLAAEGTAPTVFLSVNREGGAEFHEKALKRFQERGC